MYRWARFDPSGYEVSSIGDKRFSALFARLRDGRTIEEAYQLDIKGYRVQGDQWQLGKGKPPLLNISREALWTAYKSLWNTFFYENPELLTEIRLIAAERTLTDRYANSDISQARAIAEILEESDGDSS